MTKQTTHVSGFCKKPYTKPLTKAYQVNPSSIVCTSPSNGSILNKKNEEYEEEETKNWF